jgi:hypothetical protein
MQLRTEDIILLKIIIEQQKINNALLSALIPLFPDYTEMADIFKRAQESHNSISQEIDKLLA